MAAIFAFIGAFWRRWFGYGGSGPRWLKFVACAPLALIYDPWWHIAVAVLYFVPGHKFAIGENERISWRFVAKLGLRYAVPGLLIGIIIGNLWFAAAGVAVVLIYLAANVIRVKPVNSWLDGSFAVAEMGAGFVIFGALYL